jgi:LemA protein
MRHKILIITVSAVFVIGVIFGGICIGGYNSLVKQDETTSTNYAQVQSLLKKRHDKITQLLGVLEAEIHEEQAIIEAITSVRASYTADTPASDAAETASFNHLLAVVEDNSPTYLSESGFVAVMDEISEAENELGVGRKDFNDSVRTYNTSIRAFPTNMVAGMFRLPGAKGYWAVSESDAEMPTISYSMPASSAFGLPLFL